MSTTSYKKLPETFLSKYMFFSERRILFSQLTAATKVFRLAIVRFFLSFESKRQAIYSNVYKILEEAGGIMPQAALNQVTVICCVQGERALWSPRVVLCVITLRWKCVML